MIADLCASLEAALTPEAEHWLTAALRATAADPGAVHDIFPVVARRCGRAPLGLAPDPAQDVWSTADAARVVLLASVPDAPGLLSRTLTELYRAGGTPERRAVLLALDVLDGPRPDLGAAATMIVQEALRSHDTRLVAAALGPYAARHLDAAAYRHGVLKCVFMGVRPTVAAHRADAELARMLADYAHERIAAGRDVPDDVWPVLARHPAAVAASGLAADAGLPDPARRALGRHSRLPAPGPAHSGSPERPVGVVAHRTP